MKVTVIGLLACSVFVTADPLAGSTDLNLVPRTLCNDYYSNKADNLDEISLKIRDILCPPEHIPPGRRSVCGLGIWTTKAEEFDDASLRIRDILCPPVVEEPVHLAQRAVCNGYWIVKPEDLDKASLKVRDVLCPPVVEEPGQLAQRAICWTAYWVTKVEDLEEASLKIRDILCPP